MRLVRLAGLFGASSRHVSRHGTLTADLVRRAEEFVLIGYCQNVFECHRLLGKLQSKGVCPINVILHGMLGKRGIMPGAAYENQVTSSPESDMLLKRSLS
jgi:hypothetical protein